MSSDEVIVYVALGILVILLFLCWIHGDFDRDWDGEV